MEAVAKFEFKASHPDELDFRQNDVVKLINLDVDQGWYKGELQGREGVVPQNYLEVRPHPWYEKSGRDEAETKLLEKTPTGIFKHSDGTFLIRPSREADNFSLTVKSGVRVQHYRILREKNGLYYVWDGTNFNSLNELVEHYQVHPLCPDGSLRLKILQNEPAPQPFQEQVVSNYNYNPTEPDELTLKKGDIITVINKEDPDWWMGELRRGGKSFKGLFPVTYVSKKQ